MEMKNLRNPQEEEEDDEEDFVPKKGGSSHRVGDGKSGDQKVNTPRSKHSATEQRRRSKINDRFQILRDLVPQNDQKRDKASFLLEVIQYIQFLQEKVNRYEGPHQGWNQEPVKLTPWKNGHAPAECMISRSGPGPELLFSGKFDDNVSPAMVTSIPNPIVSDLHAGSAYKAIDQGPGLSGKDPQLPIPINTGMLTSVPRGGGFAQPFQRPMFDAEKNAFLPQVQVSQNRPCAEYPIATDTLTEQDPTIEGGTISIAGIYSQGLLNNLTQALQSSGVDLSQASISVQIDLGKQSINRIAACTAKDQEDLFGNRAMENSGIGSSGEESDQAHKRLKRE